jgi:lysophospholipase L1-like esterase
LVAAAALAVAGLALSSASARAAATVPWGVPQPGSDLVVHFRRPAAARTLGPAKPPGPLAACERRLLTAQDRATTPLLAVVGASFTAGVGPDNPSQSWAVLLAQRLRWDAVVYGDPGAGYMRAGAYHRGPVAAELRRIELRALSPGLVIVQAGHDDIGIPAQLEEQRVERAIALIRAEAPKARIALLTVFPGRRNRAGADRTDRAIVIAATAADRNVIIMDPLTGHWRFPQVADGLHPTQTGDAWIAARVEGVLEADGVRPTAPSAGRSPSPIICDDGVGVRQRSRTALLHSNFPEPGVASSSTRLRLASAVAGVPSPRLWAPLAGP